MIYCTVMSLGELAVTFPVSGAFVTYNSRFIDPSWGLPWLELCYAMASGVALGIGCCSNDGEILGCQTNLAAFVVIFYVLIVAINFLVSVVTVKLNLYLVPLKFWLFWVSLFWVLYCVLVVVHKVVILEVKLVY